MIPDNELKTLEVYFQKFEQPRHLLPFRTRHKPVPSSPTATTFPGEPFRKVEKIRQLHTRKSKRSSKEHMRLIGDKRTVLCQLFLTCPSTAGTAEIAKYIRVPRHVLERLIPASGR